MHYVHSTCISAIVAAARDNLGNFVVLEEILQIAPSIPRSPVGQLHGPETFSKRCLAILMFHGIAEGSGQGPITIQDSTLNETSLCKLFFHANI